MHYTEISELPNCCAIGVIEQVGEKTEAQILSAINSVRNLNRKRDIAGEPIEDSIFARGAIVATTNHEQINAIKHLTKLRFTKAFSVRNPKTGRMVTLWYKLLTRPKKNKNNL